MNKIKTGALALEPEVLERLKREVEQLGERQARTRLRVSRLTLARALAGLPVHTGTAHLIAHYLGVAVAP